jgi:hypothetical protein
VYDSAYTSLNPQASTHEQTKSRKPSTAHARRYAHTPLAMHSGCHFEGEGGGAPRTLLAFGYIARPTPCTKHKTAHRYNCHLGIMFASNITYEAINSSPTCARTSSRWSLVAMASARAAVVLVATRSRRSGGRARRRGGAAGCPRWCSVRGRAWWCR